MIIYDPSNKKAFGDPVFDDGSGVVFRYLSVRYGLSKFLPYGPNLESIDSLDKVTEKILSLRGFKIKWDLPNIFDDEVKSKLLNQIKKSGFSEAKYLVDDQTIIITPEIFNIEKKDRYYVRKSKESFRYELKKSLSDLEIEKIYAIYLRSAERKGFRAKRKEVFELHRENTNSIIAYENDEIKAFVLGEIKQISAERNLNVMYNLYTAAYDDAFDKYVGYGMYETWLTDAFANGVDKVDMYGAKAGTAYATFKRKFVYKSEEIATKKLPGSFIKYKIF